jgi:hypothetical protein
MTTALESAQITAQAHLRTITASMVAQTWQRLPHYDEANVDEWLTKVLPIILAAQSQSVALTRAYLARALDAPAASVDVEQLVGAPLRNGAAPEEVYRRPFVTVWSDLKGGALWKDAVAHGLDRASSMAATDVQLAQTHTAAAVSRVDQHVTGFERVPDPGACSLCLIASTQRYDRGELLPIHNRCGCGVRLLSEPGARGHHPELLRELKAAGEINRITAQRQAAAARKASGLDVAVHEHGEMGPVLANAADDFTTEHELH